MASAVSCSSSGEKKADERTASTSAEAEAGNGNEDEDNMVVRATYAGPGLGIAGWVLERGLTDCFPAGTKRDDKPSKAHKLATCEVSGVVEVGGRLVAASDKPVPAQPSSVFEIGMVADQGKLRVEDTPRRFWPYGPFAGLRKAEDLTKSPSTGGAAKRLVFLTTGFDRIKDDDAKWNAYNTLVAWPEGAPEEAHVVNPTAAKDADGQEVVASLSLREALMKALADEEFPDGRPYFKVEGLAGLPGNRLLFGIRESGKSFKKFEYTIDLIEAVYTVDDQGQVAIDPSTVVRVYRAPPTLVLGHRVALSSLAFDEERSRLYLLLSFEHEDRDDSLGGFLGVLPLEDLADDKPPTIVTRQYDARPLMFGHKPEGLAVLADRSLLVVHDDDRVTEQADLGDPTLSFKRAPHQMAYAVLQLAMGEAKGKTAGTK